MRFLVGINGKKTPDPAYWAARNEIIEAEDPDQAASIWVKMREGWLREDEQGFISVRPWPSYFNGGNCCDPDIWDKVDRANLRYEDVL